MTDINNDINIDAQADKLTDAQLNTALGTTDENAVKEILTGAGSTAPTPSTAQATTETPGSEGTPPATQPPVTTGTSLPETPGSKTPATAPTDKLFCGKFKTKEELIKGFENVGTALKYNPTIIKKMVELAAKGGDESIGAIEETYKELELALSKNQKIGEQSAQTPSASGKPENSAKTEQDNSGLPNTLDERVQLEANLLIRDGVIKDLQGSRTASRLERVGLPLPSDFGIDKENTAGYRNKVEAEAPWLLTELDSRIEQLVEHHSKQVGTVLRTVMEAEKKNPVVRECEIARIKKEAEQFKLTVTDEDVTKFVDEAIEKNPAVFDAVEGVNLLREGALADLWFLKNREKILKQVELDNQLLGRTQMADDIKSNGKKVPATISHSSIPSDQSKRSTTATKLDLDDPSVVDSLSDEQREKLLRASEEERMKITSN